MFVLQILERNEVLYSLLPASSPCATLACSHRVRSWPRGGTPRQALAHSKFILHSTSTVVVMHYPDTHSVFTAPPGAILSTTQVGIRVDSCHFPSPSTSAHEVGLLAHESKASYIEAVHELHQHLRPFACEMLCAQVRRVCFRRDLLHHQLVVADRLLEQQVLNLDALCLAQARSAHYGQCCTGVSVQPNWNDSTQVFGKRLNLHRLFCCTVASIQFCFGGAGGDNAWLLRPGLDQVLPCRIMPPLTDFLDCLSPAQSASARACKALG